MGKLSHDNAFVIARVRNIHKGQLEELAVAEGRTMSSMIRRLIVRAYREHISRRESSGHN